MNWAYHVARKPGELLAPASPALTKTPEATWRSYGRLFEKHSTNIVSPEFLAALAQVEAGGNPAATTYWRWRWSWNPFELYRPASSALGMYQMTDATFEQARRYCIRDHRPAAAGSWRDADACRFTGFYTRTLPSHAIEMTAAYLHLSVLEVLARRGAKASRAQRERLAAVIHLCGPGRGEAFAARRFRAAAGERCGTHSVRRYLARMERMKKRFAELRSGGKELSSKVRAVQAARPLRPVGAVP